MPIFLCSCILFVVWTFYWSFVRYWSTTPTNKIVLYLDHSSSSLGITRLVPTSRGLGIISVLQGCEVKGFLIVEFENQKWYHMLKTQTSKNLFKTKSPKAIPYPTAHTSISHKWEHCTLPIWVSIRQVLSPFQPSE